MKVAVGLTMGAVLWAGCSPSFENKTADELAESLFKALKSENQEVILPGLDPTKVCLLQGRDDTKECERDGQKARAEAAKRFQRILRGGRAAGIKWSDIEFITIEKEPPEPIKKDGFERFGEVTLRFRYEGKPYFVGLESVRHTADGWYSLDPFDHMSDGLREDR